MLFSPYAYNTAPRFSSLGRYIDPLESVRSAEPNHFAHSIAPGRAACPEDCGIPQLSPFKARVSRLRAELAAAEEEERHLGLFRKEEAIAVALHGLQQQGDRERAIQDALVREHGYGEAQEQHALDSRSHGHASGPWGHHHGHGGYTHSQVRSCMFDLCSIADIQSGSYPSLATFPSRP